MTNRDIRVRSSEPADGVHQHIRGRQRFTPVFIMLLVVIGLSTISGAVSGVGAWQARASANDTHKLVAAVFPLLTPDAIRARAEAQKAFVQQIGDVVDCYEAERLQALAVKIEREFHLPAGSLAIAPCAHQPDATTTTTAG